MRATKTKQRSCGRGRSKPTQRQLNMDELEKIVERAGTGALSDEDQKKLHQSIETLAWMQQELGRSRASLARLRSLLGIVPSEKTKDILKDGKGKNGESEGDKEDETGSSGSTSDAAETGAEGEESTAPDPEEKRPKGHGRNGASSYEGAERKPVKHDSLSSGDACPECPPTNPGTLYEQGRPAVVIRVVGRPPLQATIYELERLRCNLCGRVFTADLPPGVPGEKYHATAVAMIALLKYGSGFPFNRLERLEGEAGIPLPASTQWDLVNTAANNLKEVYEELVRQAAQGQVLYNDDTSMRVLSLRKAIDDLVAKGETKRTGIFSTGIVAELEGGQRVALYFTGKQHAGENIAELLAKRCSGTGPPIQMCDGLEHNIPKDLETIVANCLVHGRRKFVEEVDNFPDECAFVIETLGKVYKNEAEVKAQDLSADDRLRFHQAQSQPLMDALEEWMKEQFKQKLVEPNSGLGGAIKYMQKRWNKLTMFLRVAGAPLDSNVVERALKKAILHRKNGLFYRTENGARVGDLFMALIHSAELVKANPFKYLTSLLQNLDDVRAHPEQWLPWNYSQNAKPEGADGNTTSATASA